MNFPLKATPRTLGLAALALLAAAAALVRPVRRVKAGEWLAQPDGVQAGGWYPAWRRDRLRNATQPVTFDWPGRNSADGIAIGVRLTASLAPGRDVDFPAGGSFESGFAARYLAPLGERWGETGAVAIMDAGPEPLQAALVARLEADGVRTVAPRVQIVAPQSFAERYGRDRVRALSHPLLAKTLWIGYDGADWGILRPLIAAGRLPNFKRLLDGAAWGRMRPFNPMMSPLLWTSMATGRSPAEHNINDFVVQLPDGSIKAIGSNFRTTKALWEIAPLAGRNVAILDWWASYPAEETERGVILSNAVRNLAKLPHPPEHSGSTYPEDYLVRYFPRLHANFSVSAADLRPLVAVMDEELAAAQDVQAGKKPKEGKKVVQQEALLVLRDAVGMTRGNTAESLFLMRNLSPDLVAVYFEGIDMVGHRFQHCMRPALESCPKEDRARFATVVEDFYAYQDRALGQLLDAQTGPYYTLLVSDHGFRNGDDRPADLLPYTDENPVGWHHEEAVFVLKGPGVKPGELPVALSIHDVMPTVLYLLGMPVAEDFSGQVARGAFTAEFLRARPVRSVRTYEELGPPRRVAQGKVNPEVEKELLANLARLGYISPTSAAGPESAGSAPATENSQEAITNGARINKAKFLLSRGDYAGALAELNQVPEEKVKGRTVSYRVKALDGLGRKGEAAQLLRKALEGKTAEETSVLWLVNLDLALGDPDAAMRDLRQFGNSEKQQDLYWTAEGLILSHRGARGEARVKFWAALRKQPLQTAAAEQLYPDLSPAERPEFERILRAGLREDPQMGLYHFMLGGIELRTGRGAAGIESLRRAVDAEPTIDQYALDYAAALFQDRRAAEAEAVLVTLTGRHPENPGAWEALGNVRGALGSFAGAAEAFDKARAAGGGGARLYAGLAATLAKSGRVPEARKALAEGLAKHPGDPALLSVQRQLGG